MNPVSQLRRSVGLTQTRLAELAGTSQSTIAAYESGAKSPTYRTLEKIVSAVGLELHPGFVRPMTREERRSLELHHVVAAKLADEPVRIIRHARSNVRKMRSVSPGATPLLAEWRRLLALPVGDLIDALTDPRPRARELRHVTPFAGVLTPTERWNVYRRFREMDSG